MEPDINSQLIVVTTSVKSTVERQSLINALQLNDFSDNCSVCIGACNCKDLITQISQAFNRNKATLESNVICTNLPLIGSQTRVIASQMQVMLQIADENLVHEDYFISGSLHLVHGDY